MSLGQMFIQADNATTLYLAVLNHLLDRGQKVTPRGMSTLEERGASIVLSNPRRCVIDITERKLNYHFMVAEWWWIAAGDNRVESISHYCSEIAKFSDDGQIFFGAYGPRWRGQIGRVVENLRGDVDSRQAVVTIFRPGLYDFQHRPVLTRDVPCTISMQYLIREDKLETIVTMRSWDAFLGFPYDIFNFSRLGAMVAGAIGIEQGPVMVTAGSLHLYERNFEKASELIEGPERISAIELEPLPLMLDSGTMRAWEESARGGYVPTHLEPWASYVKILADRKKSRDDLDEPFKSLIPRRLDV